MKKTTDLASFDNRWYRPGPLHLRAGWYIVSGLFFKSGWFPFSGIKCLFLRMFGGKVGKGVVIKPHVNIKYPWKLEIGDHCWIGEQVWIDNLAKVHIGAHVCLSQGAMLLCGNHNYKKSSFDLIIQGITLENGVWIGAQTVVTPGTVCRSHSILTVGSIGIGELAAYSIYQGNPAKEIRKRDIDK